MTNHRHGRWPLAAGIAITLLALLATAADYGPARAGDGIIPDILPVDQDEALLAPPGGGELCLPPEMIWPTGWGAGMWAADYDDSNWYFYLYWDCSDSTYYEVEVYKVERDTIDNVNKLRDPFISEMTAGCSTFVDRCLPVYDNVYNWVSHYWRVRKACPDIGWGEWSDFAHYKLWSKTPHAASPRGDQIERSDDFKLLWTKMPWPAFRVQVADNFAFDSPLIDTVCYECDPYNCWFLVDAYRLSVGGYYWRVQAFEDHWSYARSFSIITAPTTSCPVLYRFDGSDFAVENPLLTACERSGYADVVTDYYPVHGTVSTQGNRVLFELREQDDEVTYLDDLTLLVVDHGADTRVGCGVNGDICLYRDVEAPLSAVDHTGTDRLAVLRAGDGETFTCDEPGYLELTFPSVEEDAFIVLTVPPKLKCPVITPEEVMPKAAPDEAYPLSSVTVEVADEAGGWTALPALPSREYPAEEAVPLLHSGSAPDEPVTVRVSWADRFSTDRIGQFVAADRAPRVRTLPASTWDVRRASPADNLWAGFGTGESLVLKKGDVLQVGFDCGGEVPEGQVRDYIVRAVGRYEPDYRIFPQLAPKAFRLHEAYPNPFNPTTTIEYELTAATLVQLEIFNLLGQRVALLVDERQEPGRYRVDWNTALSAGERVASGVYLCRLTANGAQQTRKLVLLK